MPTVRYQVEEVHPSGWAAAWFPSPGLTPAGQTSVRRFIHGYPGTARVTSPSPAGAFSASSSPAWRSPSSVAPDWIAPQLWWQDIAWKGGNVGPSSSGGGVSYMPRPVAQVVPPVVPIGTLGPQGPSPIAMTGRKVGGRRAMHWPRVVIRWPDLSGRYRT